MTTDEPLPALSAAEMQTLREYLGLSTKWISEKLVLNERRLVRMENGQLQTIVQGAKPPIMVGQKVFVQLYGPGRSRVVPAGQ
jgi:hypothetical protein